MNFHQLTEFVEHVADCSPKDLPVFKNYVDQALTQELFDDRSLMKDIGKFISLAQTFALSGQRVEGSTFFKLITLIKGQISMANKDSIKHLGVEEKLIGLLWTLIYRENELSKGAALRRQQFESNPLVPRLLESLYKY